jgi:tetratricopeptide (TPR) repeat protein
MQNDRLLNQLLIAVRTGQFELAVRLVPNPKTFGDSLRRLGDILHRNGYYQDALACYDAALRQTPPPPEAVFNRAVNYKVQGDAKNAETGFLAAISREPQRVAPLQMLAEVYFLTGRFDEAITYLDKALALGDDRMLRYRRKKAVLARDNRLDDPAEVFGNIYAHHAWGNDDPNRKFYSGEGSHTPQTVKTYVDAVNGFLAEFAAKPDVVDIGCGDFNIGSKICQHSGSYRALDVVAALIDHNKEAFRQTGVVFDTLDVTRDIPPACDVMFIREVFQHLSNAQISRARWPISRDATSTWCSPRWSPRAPSRPISTSQAARASGSI